MDTIKRAIYLRAREIVVEQGELRHSHGGHLCNVLYKATEDVLGVRKFSTNTFVDYQDTYHFICEFFPEFMALYDGRYWTRTEYHKSVGPPAAWWESFWNAPRLCMIDYLLSR